MEGRGVWKFMVGEVRQSKAFSSTMEICFRSSTVASGITDLLTGLL